MKYHQSTCTRSPYRSFGGHPI